MGEYPGRLVREQNVEFARRVAAFNRQLAAERRIAEQIAEQSTALATEADDQSRSLADNDAATLTATARANVGFDLASGGGVVVRTPCEQLLSGRVQSASFSMPCEQPDQAESGCRSGVSTSSTRYCCSITYETT